MAAAEGPAGDGELWQSWLPNHVAFLRLREGLKSRSPAEAEKPAASTSPSCPPLPPHLPLTRNLVFGLGGELFLWDAEDSAFLVVRLRGPSGGSLEPPLSQYQVRQCVWKATLGGPPTRLLGSLPVRVAWLGRGCARGWSRRLSGASRLEGKSPPSGSLFRSSRSVVSVTARHLEELVFRVPGRKREVRDEIHGRCSGEDSSFSGLAQRTLLKDLAHSLG